MKTSLALFALLAIYVAASNADHAEQLKMEMEQDFQECMRDAHMTQKQCVELNAFLHPETVPEEYSVTLTLAPPIKGR